MPERLTPTHRIPGVGISRPRIGEDDTRLVVLSRELSREWVVNVPTEL
jgi:hypothetical protein